MEKSGINKVLLGFIAVIITLLCIPIAMDLRNPISVSAATDYLEDRDYVVFSAAEYALLAKEATAYAAVIAAQAAVVNASTAASAAQITLDALLRHNENEVFLWLESVTDTCTLRAGTPADTFGAWAVIADNHGVNLSANFTANDGYIVEIMTHDYSELTYDDVIIEIATDAAGANVVGRMRTRTDWTYFVTLRSVVISQGSPIYYRMKSEVANSTLQADFRYYYK
jgi:hypothetical protein